MPYYVQYQYGALLGEKTDHRWHRSEQRDNHIPITHHRGFFRLGVGSWKLGLGKGRDVHVCGHSPGVTTPRRGAIRAPIDGIGWTDGPALLGDFPSSDPPLSISGF